MIRRLMSCVATEDHKEYVELACLSTDALPTSGIITGSKAKQVDTGKELRFDESGSQWVEQ